MICLSDGQPERAEIERCVRAAHASGDLRHAATLVVRGYGPEVLGFLVALLRDHEAVFAQLCENLWRGLPRFRWDSSIRTWLYTLARHAAHAFRRDPHLRRRVGMSEHPEIAELQAHVRTTTVTYLRSEVKDRVTRLRESLDPDEQTLLILRIDRQMAWTDIARIMGGDAPEAESRQAATLRKRFERLKERLRSMAVPPPETHAN
jgi:RNA polymerase sigma-70 factor (ECF subfamily)